MRPLADPLGGGRRLQGGRSPAAGDPGKLSREQIALILSAEPVKPSAVTPGKALAPSVAVVYATRDGELEVLDGGRPMRWPDQIFTKYRMRYEVDISDHHLTVEFKDNTALASKGDVYHFHARVSASFRVTDPAEVVRRNVTDAAALVRGHLLGVCRPISRQYSIEQAQEAEAAIQARFRSDTLIQGGITLYAVEARLSLDEAGRNHLQDVERAVRDDTKVNDVAREGQLDVLQQDARRLLEERERLVLENRSLDPVEMVRLHLQRNPGDTAGALEMVAKLEAARLGSWEGETDRLQDLLAFMTSANMIRPIDVAPLLDAVLRRAGASTVPPPVKPPDSAWDADRPRVLLAHMPTRVVCNVEFSLVVRVAKEPSALPGSRATPLPRLTVEGEPVKLTIVVQTTTDLLSSGPLQQVITVPANGDSEPVLFAFRAPTVGSPQVRVTAWAGGTFVAELELHVAVTTSGSHEDTGPVAAPLGRIEAEAGEVALQVSIDQGRYSFQLLSDRTWFEPVVGGPMTEEPTIAVERAMEALQRLVSGRTEYSQANTRRWMRETGAGLWSAVVPPIVQEQFWQLRSQMTSFTLASGRDQIPWEMLYPLSRTRDEGFLVEKMPVMRRAYNQERIRAIGVRDARFIVPPNSPSHAMSEVERIHRLIGESGDPQVISDLTEVLELVDSGQMGLAHFACHNAFDAKGSRINMDGGPFVPTLLNSAVTQKVLQRSHPLVFLNACRSAGSIPEYTRMMGWASQFMGAGAGAFIGTLWSVRSDASARFAESFYSALMSGQTLGQAALKARLDVSADAGDPTWLAYTVYGDPRATVAT
ncbi:CHAT domain-containing protein [Dactylosporangium darangshiense]|uniref:CHAT domain-containing protein n=1 Tax=Dactylosporangium darangshiense TaxID=579108 RepID=UPI00363E565D